MMSLEEVRRALDVARSDSDRVKLLESLLLENKVASGAVRACVLMLANLYVLLHEFRRAVELYESVGMVREASRVRSRII